MVYLVITAVYVVVLALVYAVLGVARKADEIAEYQYKEEFGEYESR